MELPDDHIERLALAALAEDLGELPGPGALSGDITSTCSVPAPCEAEARILSRGEGVLAGMAVAKRCFELLDPDIRFSDQRADGDPLVPGDVVLRLCAQARALLAAERSALNFLQRLCGIATRTRQYVHAVAGTRARILHTRKTTPGLRALELAAVRAGGGGRHRAGLSGQVLLKENHFALARGNLEETVRRATRAGEQPVIAEARNQAEAEAAVRGGAGVVMLDNLGPADGLAESTRKLRRLAAGLGRPLEIEASGGINLDNVRAYAEAGVDRISVGALTHSVPALDLTMLMAGVGPPGAATLNR